MSDNGFFVISGGPGAGKTTLLAELERSGYSCVAEVAREVILEQLSIGGDGLPWINVSKYTDLMLDLSLKTYETAMENGSSITFFDRGIPDSIAYAHLAGISISPALEKAARSFRYNNPVFMLPPWPEIYVQDEARKENFDFAVETYTMLKKVFAYYGYACVEVPKLSVAARAAFLLKSIR